MTALAPDGRTLTGRFLRLTRTVLADAPALFRALDDEQVYDSDFGGGPAGRPSNPDRMSMNIGASLATPGRTPYTIQLLKDSDIGAAGTVLGTTSLRDLNLPDERLHLGDTAYNPVAWRSFVNPEAKLLLLTHVFEDCNFGRASFHTDSMNERSQGSLDRLGAVREGLLRRHQVRADGSFRDTVVFSIVKDEWPAVKAGLEERLAAY